MPFNGPKTFGGRRFTPAEDNDILEARALGMTFPDIAILLGTGRCAYSLSNRFSKLAAREIERKEHALVVTRARDRTCLRCRQVFPSSDPGNRRCAPCAEAIADMHCTEATVHGFSVD